MAAVSVRGVTLGNGHCRIILPIVEKTTEAICARGKEFAALGCDLIEWRADWFEQAADRTALLDCLQQLRRAVGETPLLVTFRTRAEGGEREIDAAQYGIFCQAVCESGCADLLDAELFTEAAVLHNIITTAHTHGLAVVCSSHDFAKTPPKDEMVARLCRMQALGADIAKLAVMPHSRSDVAALRAATAEMADLHPQPPVITMSMGALGQVSRVAGASLGSCATFACAGAASAPGQMSLVDARAALSALEQKKI